MKTRVLDRKRLRERARENLWQIRKPLQPSMANYLDFLQAPLSAYQQSMKAAQAATRQVLDAVQKVNE